MIEIIQGKKGENILICSLRVFDDLNVIHVMSQPVQYAL